MALKGSLIDMSLVDLLQVFGMSAKTGRLMMDHSDDYGGMLWISNGRIANAAIVEFKTRNTVVTGEPAVIEMLQWEEATFRFIPALPGETYQLAISRPNEWLILEGLRRRDEQVGKSIYPQITLDTRLRLVAQPSSANERLNLNHDEWTVLTHSANAKTIAQVLAATGYPESEMFAILGRLMALRLIDLERDESVPILSLPPSIITADLATEQV
jgi:hypothetical protein